MPAAAGGKARDVTGQGFGQERKLVDRDASDRAIIWGLDRLRKAVTLMPQTRRQVQMHRLVWRTLLAMASVSALSGAGWLLASRFAETGEPPADKIDRLMQEESSKERFSGQIGDFLVLPLENGEGPEEARIFRCANSPVAKDDRLRASELWSARFEDGGAAWVCPGEGVTLVNNEGGGRATNGGVLEARGYIDAVPVPVVRDAPKDRLDLVDIKGHPGLLERPIEGYPYGKANLTVIERYPDEKSRGIIVIVELANSADDAITRAEEMLR